MSTTRRDFIIRSALATGAVGLGLPGLTGCGGSHRRLNILILGGTGFIGPYQVRYALERGHTLTLFNRGRTAPDLFPDLETLIGDRAVGDYESLKGRDWDVVIDNPTSLPRWVRQAAEVLKGHTSQYLFVSTLSVYSDNSILDQDETGPLATVDDPTTEVVDGRTYGGLKALSEAEAEKQFPGHATVVRPGLIVGPGDPSDRFTYWPVRVARGGEVLAPGDPHDVVQIIDARDLSEWIVRMVEMGATGIYNATGPEEPLPMGEMLSGIKAGVGGDATFTWADAEWLASQGVHPWSHMPVWYPPVEGMEGFSRFSIARAREKGMTFRPLSVTALDTVEWYQAKPEEERQRMRAGLTPEREAEVLAAWHAREATGAGTV
jgi:2'-hydroxyisoflavone reductase